MVIIIALLISLINRFMHANILYAPINGIPHSRIGWGNSGDLTEYHVKNPSPGVSPDVTAPIYLSPRIDRGCHFTHPRGELLSISGQLPCIAQWWGSGGVIDRCIINVVLMCDYVSVLYISWMFLGLK